MGLLPTGERRSRLDPGAMPTDGLNAFPTPCRHVEIAERFLTAEAGLVFCLRCQRHYTCAPDVHLRELLTVTPF